MRYSEPPLSRLWRYHTKLIYSCSIQRTHPLGERCPNCTVLTASLAVSVGRIPRPIPESRVSGSFARRGSSAAAEHDQFVSYLTMMTMPACSRVCRADSTALQLRSRSTGGAVARMIPTLRAVGREAQQSLGFCHRKKFFVMLFRFKCCHFAVRRTTAILYDRARACFLCLFGAV